MNARAEADKVNDFGRDPIGEGREEQRYNKDLKTLLTDRRDDAASVEEIGENRQEEGRGRGKDEKNKGKGGDGGGGGKKRLPLEEITRYTMVKRIW